MNEPMATYQSYLVRLWRDSLHAMWRASAQSVQTHEIVHFADLDALFIFLGAQTTSGVGPTQLEGGAIGWGEEGSSPVHAPFSPRPGES